MFRRIGVAAVSAVGTLLVLGVINATFGFSHPFAFQSTGMAVVGVTVIVSGVVQLVADNWIK